MRIGAGSYWVPSRAALGSPVIEHRRARKPVERAVVERLLSRATADWPRPQDLDPDSVVPDLNVEDDWFD